MIILKVEEEDPATEEETKKEGYQGRRDGMAQGWRREREEQDGGEKTRFI